jgi:MFS superfamily sulfate permease-like transporter
VYSVGLIQPAEFIAIRKVRTMEFRWAVAAALGVLLFGTLQGILVAIIASLISLSTQATRPMVHVIGRKRGADVLRPLSPEHADDETFDGLLILRPEGRLFFANVQNVADQIKALTLQYQPRVLALDLSRVPDIEYSALQMLMESEQRATERGAVLWLVGLNPTVLEVVRRAGFDQRLGDRMVFNARMVIERYQALQAMDGVAAVKAAEAAARPLGAT